MGAPSKSSRPAVRLCRCEGGSQVERNEFGWLQCVKCGREVAEGTVTAEELRAVVGLVQAAMNRLDGFEAMLREADRRGADRQDETIDKLARMGELTATELERLSADDRLMTTKEAADFIRAERKWVLAHKQELGYLPGPSGYRFTRGSILAGLERMKGEGREPTPSARRRRGDGELLPFDRSAVGSKRAA